MLLSEGILPGLMGGLVAAVVANLLIAWLKRGYEPALREYPEFRVSRVFGTVLAFGLVGGVVYYLLVSWPVVNPPLVFLTIAEGYATLGIATPILARKPKPFVVWVHTLHYLVATIVGVLLPIL